MNQGSRSSLASMSSIVAAGEQLSPGNTVPDTAGDNRKTLPHGTQGSPRFLPHDCFRSGYIVVAIVNSHDDDVLCSWRRVGSSTSAFRLGLLFRGRRRWWQQCAEVIVQGLC